MAEKGPRILVPHNHSRSIYVIGCPIYLVHKRLLLIASVATEEGTRFASKTTVGHQGNLLTAEK